MIVSVVVGNGFEGRSVNSELECLFNTELSSLFWVAPGIKSEGERRPNPEDESSKVIVLVFIDKVDGGDDAVAVAIVALVGLAKEELREVKVVVMGGGNTNVADFGPDSSKKFGLKDGWALREKEEEDVERLEFSSSFSENLGNEV